MLNLLKKLFLALRFFYKHLVLFHFFVFIACFSSFLSQQHFSSAMASSFFPASSSSKKQAGLPSQKKKKKSKTKERATKKPMKIKKGNDRESLPEKNTSLVIPVTQNSSLSKADLKKQLIHLNTVTQSQAIHAQPSPHRMEKIEGRGEKREDDSSSLPSILNVSDKFLTFTSKKLPGLAFIKIFDAYWIFLDTKYPIHIPKTYPFGILDISDQSNATNTILKLKLRHDFWPNISTEKQRWIIEFNTSPRLSRTKKSIRWPDTMDKPLKILMPGFVSEIDWIHPETYIPYAVYTSRKQDGAFMPHQTFPQLSLMESYIGLALHPKADSLVVQRDVEDLNIFNALGMIIPDDFLKSSQGVSFLSDKRVPYKINSELQRIKNLPETPEHIVKTIELGLKLGLFSEVSAQLKNLRKLCPKGVWSDNANNAKIDFMQLVLLTLSHGNEDAGEDVHFVNHSDQSPEFKFWYALYKRKPQNYGAIVTHILSTYPLFIKNRIIEILLTLPDECENLKTLLGLQGIHNDLKERARLKLALMQPIDIRELNDLAKGSHQREIKAKATLQLLYEMQKQKDFNLQSAIEKLEEFLFNFSDKEFEAKTFLGKLYVAKKDYFSAIRLFNDLLPRFKDWEDELKASMKDAYFNFFQDVFDKMAHKKKRTDTKSNTKKELATFDPKPLDIVAFYNDFNHLTPEGEVGEKILDTVIQALEALNLYKPAIDILNRLLEQSKDPQKKKELTFRVAHAYILNKLPKDAEKALIALQSSEKDEDVRRKTALLIDIYLLQNEPLKAFLLVENCKDIDSLLQKERIYWFMKDFEKILTHNPSLIQHVENKDRKAELATHIAIANVLTKNPSFDFFDLRQRYDDIVKGTAFEKDFMTATTPEIKISDGLRHFDELNNLLTK